ncbi:MAG: selenide, water dikinase SelD [Candidatus Dormibacteraeota bacterium]|nr:selenide, water dikinase SelD [Candidatus Dormibacteraeota bacterium]
MPVRLPNPDVLVGTETGDDAAVYRVRPDLALVATTDFFTPVVDDAYTFGAIAAANALSDVYAMGGVPLFAINLVAFPIKELPRSVLADILRGGADKVREAGIDILGGHSIDDHEPKYGLAVTGTVHPDRVVRNRGGLEGDALILTKALGTGVITTAIKHEVAPPRAEQAAIAAMLRLNRQAAAAMLAVEVHAATDVTGFGLLGHLHYLALASGLSATVDARAVPLLPDAELLADAGEVPGGTRSNERFLAGKVTFGERVPGPHRTLLCDAQTSGGLLIAVPEAAAAGLIADLRSKGEAGVRIGSLRPGPAGQITVT